MLSTKKSIVIGLISTSFNKIGQLKRCSEKVKAEENSSTKIPRSKNTYSNKQKEGSLKSFNFISIEISAK